MGPELKQTHSDGSDSRTGDRHIEANPSHSQVNVKIKSISLYFEESSILAHQIIITINQKSTACDWGAYLS
jgi:hypothetical protein